MKMIMKNTLLTNVLTSRGTDCYASSVWSADLIMNYWSRNQQRAAYSLFSENHFPGYLSSNFGFKGKVSTNS